MFGKNEIVGKKYFKDADKQQMFVTSMFMTLQGEGPYRGMPAFFIRLAKCNLACSFCDTFFDDGDWLTFDQIEERIETTIDDFYKSIDMDRPDWTKTIYEDTVMVSTVINQSMFADTKVKFDSNRIKADTTYADILNMNIEDGIISKEEAMVLKLSASDSLHDAVMQKVYSPRKVKTKKRMVLVMTGGEPMLQDNIGPFLERMAGIFENTQIESNGTQNTAIPESTTLVISPKCAEKKDSVTGEMIATKYLTPRKEVLERASCLKFVMEANSDSPYSVVPDWAHEWAKVFNRPIFVSPMNEYNAIPQKSKQKRATSNQITLDERSTVDEVISFWEPGLLNMAENQKNHEYAARYCVTHGFILNLQIHLYASLA